MAEEKKQTQKLEREYTIPLRNICKRAASYKKTRRAVKAIKEFIAKHMKVVDRNVDNVRLDVQFNNEIWFRGRSSPPAKVRVKAVKEGDIVRVTFAEMPQRVKFDKAKSAKFHKEADKKAEKKEELPENKESKEEKAEKVEERKNEVEKEKSVEIQHSKEAKQQAIEQKHTTKMKEPEIHRKAMSR